MCGIIGIWSRDHVTVTEQTVQDLVKEVSYRGPDETSVHKISENCIFGHCRLSIIGVASGSQPLYSVDKSIVVTLNGEIYNYLTLRKQFEDEYDFQTNCDTEILIPLYIKYGPMFIEYLNGMFAFALYDKNKDYFMAARDHVGIVSAYYGTCSKDNSLWIASELKSLKSNCEKVYTFPPGCIIDGIERVPRRYYQPSWYLDHIQGNLPNYVDDVKMTLDECEQMYKQIRTLLESAVHGTLSGITEVRAGLLLSGGLDSSIIASIAARAIKNFPPSSLAGKTVAYSVGLEGSPDVIAAKKVADFIGIEHVVRTFTQEEGIEAIRRVVYHLETFDVTTIRASIPMFFLSERVRQDGVKFVLSGEGADEVFGGYLYFHEAPNSRNFQNELVDRVLSLNTSDCLRANKSCLAHSVEPRVPMLDKYFLEYALGVIPPNQKMVMKPPYNHRMEKFILRKAFDTRDNPYLPDEILWRQKEQFSDGVGYCWIDALKSFTESQVTDTQMLHASKRFPRHTPTTKEAYWYRTVFEEFFPEPQCIDTVVLWTPKLDWGCDPDPSGRSQRAHINAIMPSAVKVNGFHLKNDI